MKWWESTPLRHANTSAKSNNTSALPRNAAVHLCWTSPSQCSPVRSSSTLSTLLSFGLIASQRPPGVSNKHSPCKIVLGRKISFTKHCKATFGSYIEAHNDPTITNTMRLCTFPGIFLGPTGNHQGTHKVFDINTGVVKKTHSITPLPMPDRVIKIVNDWGRRH